MFTRKPLSRPRPDKAAFEQPPLPPLQPTTAPPGFLSRWLEYRHMVRDAREAERLVRDEFA